MSVNTKMTALADEVREISGATGATAKEAAAVLAEKVNRLLALETFITEPVAVEKPVLLVAPKEQEEKLAVVKLQAAMLLQILVLAAQVVMEKAALVL